MVAQPSMPDEGCSAEARMEEIKLNLLAELTSQDPSLEFYLRVVSGRTFERRDERPFLQEEYRDLALTVRYLSGGKAGLTYTLSLTEDEVLKGVERAKLLSQCGKEAIYPPLPQRLPEVKTEPKRELSFEEMETLLGDTAQRKKDFPRLLRIERDNLSVVEEEEYLIREGRILSFKGPSYSYFVSVMAEDERSAQGFAFNSSQNFHDLDLGNLFSEACRSAEALARAKKGTSHRCSVLFTPSIGITLLELLSFSFLGDEVFKGRSKLKGRLGEGLFNENLTLVDDGLRAGLTEAKPFDDEGLPQQRTILIERGVVKNFLFDTLNGGKLGFPSTGNARRPSIGQNPKPAFTNLYLEGGDKTREELLQATPYVFELCEILGAHTADPVSGEFSFGVGGILYRHGETVDYLAEMALTGNIFEVLSGELLLGKDLTFYGNLGSPSLLLPNLTLG